MKSGPDGVVARQEPDLTLIDEFKRTIYAYYHEHGRRLPWRETRDPYAILVSEVMLQQTQVDRVIDKYDAFLRLFPDFGSLARASLADVLRVWQGLGYQRRALALKKAAERVVGDLGSALPSSPDILGTLPGIGPATACAIAAFAFGRPTVFVETNIRTVFIRFFFPGRDDVADRDILPLIAMTLDEDDPRSWYYALMDYGSMLKKSGDRGHRRSTAYRRQSPYEGSDRQARANILRYLLTAPGAGERQMSLELGLGRGRVERLLRVLEKEGFVKPAGKGYEPA